MLSISAKTMDQLLQLPLSPEEERHLVEYLETSQDAQSMELLTMHYLQQSCYIEAIRCNAKLRHSVMVGISTFLYSHQSCVFLC